MAYMNQEHKAQIRQRLSAAIPKSWKWSLAVRNHSTIVLTIKSAPVDLIDLYTRHGCSDEVRASCIAQRSLDVNPYHWREHFDDELRGVFTVILEALNLNNHDRSDVQSDYFDVGHYVSIHFGRWDKPFLVTQESA